MTDWQKHAEEVGRLTQQAIDTGKPVMLPSQIVKEEVMGSKQREKTLCRSCGSTPDDQAHQCTMILMHEGEILRCGCHVCRKRFAEMARWDAARKAFPGLTWPEFAEKYLHPLKKFSKAQMVIRSAKELLALWHKHLPQNYKLYFYYLRCRDDHPVITVCLLGRGDQWARGWSLTHPDDNPCKVVGRYYAMRYARISMENARDELKIISPEMAEQFSLANFTGDVLDFIEGSMWPGAQHGFEFGQYEPDLTDYELKILKWLKEKKEQ